MQPEHRVYRYDYFRDNCSTRIRDALDRVTGGALRTSSLDDPPPSPTVSRPWPSPRRTSSSPPAWTWASDPSPTSPSPAGSWPSYPCASATTSRDPHHRARRRHLDTPRRRLMGAAAHSLPRRPAGVAPSETSPRRRAHRPPAHRAPAGRTPVRRAGWLAPTTADPAGRPRRRPPATRGPLLFTIAASAWALVTGALGTHPARALDPHRPRVRLAQREPAPGQSPRPGPGLSHPPGRPGRTTRDRRPHLAAALAALSLMGLLVHPLPLTPQANLPIIALALPIHLALAASLWHAVPTRRRRA
jgi:hypothetical protein